MHRIYIPTLGEREVTILGLDNEGDQEQVWCFWLGVKNEERDFFPHQLQIKNTFNGRNFNHSQKGNGKRVNTFKILAPAL